MCTPARFNVGLTPAPAGDMGSLNCTELPSDGRTIDRCSDLSFEYELPTSLVCGLGLVFGILYTLFGYRCFKAVMFLTGFTFGSAVVYLICEEQAVLPPLGNAGVSLGAGLLLGVITLLVQYVGLFMTGFHTGLYCGVVIIVVVSFFHRLRTVWISVAVLLGWGLLFALANLRLQKSLTVFGTSVHGAAVIAVSMDFFVEQWMMAQWVLDRVRLAESQRPCWFSWLVLSLWPLMTLVGLAVQGRITGRGTHHKAVARHHQPLRAVSLQRLRSRHAREELRQRKYRYLYQVRAAHGDIISQKYVLSLNKMAAPGDESTLQSDCTRVTSVNEQPALTALSESDYEADVLKPADRKPTQGAAESDCERRENAYGDREL
ncbi:transmembrane protein 198-like [Pollicipes pollicipes]|uniref:transmembrane protein 198-like n=1 Tax=Pollicipes pollicipes TaxID=41117 RepID=UPI001885A2A7|nr:transmembrane protein 198-like [Pollicipes pollicipes]XP_037090319.1 transmembrane protein 198-like [Pollicipes pollicipes]